MKEGQDSHFLPVTSVASGTGHELRNDIYYYTNQIVNIVLIGDPKDKEFVLVDTGMPSCSKEIIRIVQERFGDQAVPKAIVLTHGHFDHVGNLVELLKAWEVPVYAHELEFPYLNGQKDYPKPDSSVQGGLLAKVSFLYPHCAIDVSEALVALPEDHSVPPLPEWKWIHTPGHSPGHVSLYRESDKTMISGDAFITVRQDLLYNVLVQKEEVNGPPRYLTTDWKSAYESVLKLDALQPVLVIPGHGKFMAGKELSQGLETLVREFDTKAIPDHGKFVRSDDRFFVGTHGQESML